MRASILLLSLLIFSSSEAQVIFDDKDRTPVRQVVYDVLLDMTRSLDLMPEMYGPVPVDFPEESRIREYFIEFDNGDILSIKEHKGMLSTLMISSYDFVHDSVETWAVYESHGEYLYSKHSVPEGRPDDIIASMSCSSDLDNQPCDTFTVIRQRTCDTIGIRCHDGHLPNLNSRSLFFGKIDCLPGLINQDDRIKVLASVNYDPVSIDSLIASFQRPDFGVIPQERIDLAQDMFGPMVKSFASRLQEKEDCND